MTRHFQMMADDNPVPPEHPAEGHRHIATCSTCLEMTQSKDDSVMVVGETHHKGLASMLGCQFGCGKELTFATSTETTG